MSPPAVALLAAVTPAGARAIAGAPAAAPAPVVAARSPALDALQVVLLVLVALGALLVVASRRPRRLVISMSAYGFVLGLLFLAFQAPDVTLSELVVGAVALPLLLLLALAKMRRPEE